MKRIKIMLLSFALLAVVGGALAFKAKFDQTFCYTTVLAYDPGSEPPPTCTSTLDLVTTTIIANGQTIGFSYTTDAQDLGNGLSCYTWEDEPNGPTIPLNCPTKRLIKSDE